MHHSRFTLSALTSVQGCTVVNNGAVKPFLEYNRFTEKLDGIPVDNQMATAGIPSDNQLTTSPEPSCIQDGSKMETEVPDFEGVVTTTSFNPNRPDGKQQQLCFNMYADKSII